MTEKISETLTVLSEQYKLGLLTDGYLVAQKRKVESLGLERLMLTILYTDELGRENWKPNPAPFRRIIEELDTPPESCIYFGDNPEKDFKGAKDIGMLTVQVLQWTRKDEKEIDESCRPHLYVDRFIEIPGLVEKVNKTTEA